MRKLLATCAVTVLTLSLTATAALAQVKDQSYKDWTVYTTTLQGKKTCYIASFPTGKSGTYSKRDEPYFLVTRIGPTAHEVSTSSGYPYQSSSEVKVDVDGQKFEMFTKGELAWAPDAEKDKTMLAALKKGVSMTVRGTSQKGTYSLDTYSLRGISAAFDRMNALCK